MNRPFENLEAEALELSPSERARLASLLLASLEEDPAAPSDEIDGAWSDEIQKRVQQIRSGNAKLVPAEDVLSNFRNRHA
jgi:putative addiction module component (TIGR02574 family)